MTDSTVTPFRSKKTEKEMPKQLYVVEWSPPYGIGEPHLICATSLDDLPFNKDTVPIGVYRLETQKHYRCRKEIHD